MSPVLVPAFPAVLPYVSTVRHDAAEQGWTVLNVDIRNNLNADGKPDGTCKVHNVLLHSGDQDDVPWWTDSALFVDLRDPAVRDAVVRAIWRTLRPTEPEPLTAPCFYSLIAVGTFNRWTIEHPEGGLSTDFGEATHPDKRMAGHVMVILALGSVPTDSPDRDLLALAEVAKAVLS